MKLLLLGAGFSRNWGGWLADEAFEFLLGCPEIIANKSVAELLWKHQGRGGFEAALGDVQKACILQPGGQNQLNRQALQGGIARMFDQMNLGFFRLPQFEFQNSQDRQVATALTKFDAIFTLNQDLLLEHWYMNDNVALLSGNRWSNGCRSPGLTTHASTAADRQQLQSLARFDCSPIPGEAPLQIDGHMQPYFKLHGSSNWTDHIGGPVMIMGANKVQDMTLHPILLRYMQAFEEHLNAADSRLMVIGYGFRDEHINQVIQAAVLQSGLRLFVVDPAGANVAWRVNPKRANVGAIHNPAELESDLERAFRAGLMGASRRPLSGIFGNDGVEHAKVMRFFD